MGKADDIRALIADCKYRRAMALAATIQSRKPTFKLIKRAHAAYNYPDFYRQIGRDPAQEVQDGIIALIQEFDLKHGRPNHRG